MYALKVKGDRRDKHTIDETVDMKRARLPARLPSVLPVQSHPSVPSPLPLYPPFHIYHSPHDPHPLSPMANIYICIPFLFPLLIEPENRAFVMQRQNGSRLSILYATYIDMYVLCMRIYISLQFHNMNIYIYVYNYSWYSSKSLWHSRPFPICFLLHFWKFSS